jgi:hypothetical protein
VIRGEVVECELTGLDYLHHLGCDHRLGDAGDAELIVDPHVSNAVRLAHSSTPSAIGGHHRGRHTGSVGRVAQGSLELPRGLFGDRFLADVGERRDREGRS